jgi:hypothetical protein
MTFCKIPLKSSLAEIVFFPVNKSNGYLKLNIYLRKLKHFSYLILYLIRSVTIFELIKIHFENIELN